MLVLLPPSEAKAKSPSRGRPLDLAAMAFPELAEARAAIVQSLVSVCDGDREVALQTLGLPPGLAAQIEVNRRLLQSATRPVADLYTGVLYEALGLASLPAAARRRATRTILVFSGLWGVLRLADRVPAYRMSPAVVLPGVGPLTAHWRNPLSTAMADACGSRLVLDLRSTGYTRLWRPPASTAHRTVTVRVLHEVRPGDPSSRTVVSHFNKATKGHLVRELLIAGVEPKNPAQLAAALTALGYAIETTPGPARKPGRPHQIDVIVRDIQLGR